MNVKPSQRVARQVREYRHKNGLSQQRLADLSGVPFRTIQNIEAGVKNPNVETLAMLDDIGVPVAEVFAKTLTFDDAQKLLTAFERAPRAVREVVLDILANQSEQVPRSGSAQADQPHGAKPPKEP